MGNLCPTSLLRGERSRKEKDMTVVSRIGELSEEIIKLPRGARIHSASLIPTHITQALLSNYTTEEVMEWLDQLAASAIDTRKMLEDS